MIHSLMLAAALGNVTSIEGRVIHISVSSISVVASHSGAVAPFHLEPYFADVFTPNGKTEIPISRVHVGSIVKVFYDTRFTGTRRAERIELLRP